MDTERVKELLKSLDWNFPPEIQQNAIDILSKVDETYYPLLFDWSSKSTWENSVKIVKQIGFPQNKILLANLFTLLQDINWPGANSAINVLKDIDKQYLLPKLEEYIKLAYQTSDDMWLGGLKRLTMACHLTEKDFSSTEIYDMLKYSNF